MKRQKAEYVDKLVSERTGMPVFIAENALECVVKGTGKTLEDLEKLKTFNEKDLIFKVFLFMICLFSSHTNPQDKI